MESEEAHHALGWVRPEIEQRPEHNRITRFLSDAEREALLIACKQSEFDRLYLLVLMAVTCGARRSELLGLRWSDIDMERGEASLHRTKNDTPRVLPLTPPVVEELRRFEGGPTDLVFGSTRHPGQPYHFITSWQSALKAAGVKKFRFHDLRHSAASMFAMNDVDIVEIASLLGHKSLRTSQRYVHLSTERKRATVARVMGKVGKVK